jgi:tetratricopeptide (TPR) repeat protein
MNNLAKVHTMQGKYVQAEAQHAQTLAISRRVLGPEHPDTLNCLYGLAAVYAMQSKPDEAEPLYLQVLEARRRALGPEHPDTLAVLSGLATFYQRQGRYPVAETYARQALAGLRQALGPDHLDTMDGTASLALACQAQGRFAESENLARQAVAMDRQKRPDDWRRFHTESLLGASLAAQKKFAEAEPLLLGGCQGILARRDRMALPDRDFLDRVLDQVIEFYNAWGKPEQAAVWRAKKQSVDTTPTAR